MAEPIYPVPSDRQFALAARIADYLLTDGSGRHAERLVLELPSGDKLTSAWGRAALVRHIATLLALDETAP